MSESSRLGCRLASNARCNAGAGALPARLVVVAVDIRIPITVLLPAVWYCRCVAVMSCVTLQVVIKQLLGI